MVRTKQSNPKRWVPGIGRIFVPIKTERGMKMEIQDSINQVQENHPSVAESPADMTAGKCVITLDRSTQNSCIGQPQSWSSDSEKKLSKNPEGKLMKILKSINIALAVSLKRFIYCLDSNFYCIIIWPFDLVGSSSWEEKTLCSKLEFIRPCNVVLEHFKVPTNITVHPYFLLGGHLSNCARFSHYQRLKHTTINKMLQVSPQSGQHVEVEVTVKNEHVTEDEESTEGADINMEKAGRQEVINMQAGALAKYNREAQANKEKTLSAKLELIKPCSVVLERLKVPTSFVVHPYFLARGRN
jgi:hypothetical protein